MPRRRAERTTVSTHPVDRSVTRREFVRHSTAAGLATGSVALTTLPTVLRAGALGNEKEVRLAWIGVGGRGTSLLQQALSHVPTSKLTVKAICDIDPAARERAVSLCGPMRPVGIDDYRRVLDMKDVDAVFIATPIYLHREMAVAGAVAGKHMYCEKPLGRTAEEVAAVDRAISDSNVRFQVGFQWRYDKRWQTSIRQVHEGAIGKVHFVSASRHVAGYPTSGWYIDRALSGDLIVEQAVHEMNIFCWLMKGPPLRAAGFGGINAFSEVPPDRSIMDHYTVSFEFPENVRLSYSHCVYTAPGIGGLEQMAMGRSAAMDLRNATVHKDGKHRTADLGPLPNATGEAIASFVDCVRNDKEPLSNLEMGKNATLMAILGRTAMYEGRVVEWKEVTA